MEEREEPRNNLMRRLQSSFATSSSSIPNIFDLSQLNSSQISSPPNFSQHLSSDNNKRPGIPPSHPNLVPSSHYSQFSPSRSPTPPSHSRSLSQPAFFSFDSLPPLSPSPYREASSPSLSDPISADVSMEDRDGRSTSVRIGESLPPRKAHRRSHSEIPFVFSSSPSPPLLAHRSQGFLGRSASVRETSGTNRPNQFVKQEIDWDKDGNIEGTGERKSEGESGDDLLSAYMNLDNIDVLNTSGTEDKNGLESREDLDSRASVTKNNGVDGSDNEVDSSANRSLSHSSVVEKKEGNKRGAGDSANLNERSSRHFRSISMDSFMGRMQNFGDESPKLNPSPELATNSKSMTNPINGSLPSFNLEFANGEFSPAELKKIMANEKLTEIAMSDPKRAKRILANRQSAARSKERKMQYISELEHKVQTLQTEATTLSAQLTLLQRDSAGLTTQNNELKFRLQAMEQQAKLRDALNEALTAEVQRLKLVTGTQTGETHLSGNLSQQLMMNSHIFQMHQQPRTANHFPNFQSSPPSQNPPTSKSESNQ